MITAGIDGIFIFDFVYKGKYEPKHAAQIDPEGKSIEISLKNKIPLEKMLLWAKGLKIDLTNDMIISWDQTRLSFNHLKGGGIIFSYKDMTTAENYITDVLVIKKPFKYFVTGTYSGQVQVWKFSEKRRLINSFEGAHIKEIGSLAEYPGIKGVPGTVGDPTLFISSSLDGSVKVWSLDVSFYFWTQSLIEVSNGLSISTSLCPDLQQPIFWIIEVSGWNERKDANLQSTYPW